MHAPLRGRLFAALLLMLSGAPSFAADLVTLSPQTWDRYAPDGKEADAIYGDFVLANDQLMAVIGQPRAGRNANMTVHDVGGCVVDLTRRDRQSDQLSAFYPGAQLRDLRFAGVDVESPKVYEAGDLENVFVQARRVTLRLVATPREKEPDVAVSYTLEDGSPYVVLTSTFTNRGKSPVSVDLVDSLRADKSFDFSPNDASDLFWAYDKHFGQAYGVTAEDHEIQGASGRARMIRYQNKDGKVAVRLAPGESYTLTRHLIPGANLFDVVAVARQISKATTLTVKDSAGKPVSGADVVLSKGDRPQAWGRTDGQGNDPRDPGGRRELADGFCPRPRVEDRRTGGRLALGRASGSGRRRNEDHRRPGRSDPLQDPVRGPERHQKPGFRPRFRRVRHPERLLQPRRPCRSGARTRVLRGDRQLRTGT